MHLEFLHYLFNSYQWFPIYVEDLKRFLDTIESAIPYAYLILLIDRIKYLIIFQTFGEADKISCELIEASC